MSEESLTQSSPGDATRLLSTLHQLTVAACRSTTRQALIFHILNEPVALCKYDRAHLWSFENNSPRLLGISGRENPAKYSALMDRWQSIVSGVENHHESQVVEKFTQGKAGDEFADLREENKGISALWLPIQAGDRLVAGLLLERWGEVQWQNNELRLLEHLVSGYSALWEQFFLREKLFIRLINCFRRKPVLIAILIVCLVIGFFCPVNLKVVAPCEVVAMDPVIISAPLEGVVEKINVSPGQEVSIGEQLYSYDKRIPLQELAVARKQVQIAVSQVNLLKAKAYEQDKARAELVILERRLQQEKMRLELAEHNARQLKVVSPVAGAVMIQKPHEWKGKPVRVGERVMAVVDPGRTIVRIWIPEDDNISFNWKKDAKIILNVEPS